MMRYKTFFFKKKKNGRKNGRSTSPAYRNTQPQQNISGFPFFNNLFLSSFCLASSSIPQHKATQSTFLRHYSDDSDVDCDLITDLPAYIAVVDEIDMDQRGPLDPADLTIQVLYRDNIWRAEEQYESQRVTWLNRPPPKGHKGDLAALAAVYLTVRQSLFPILTKLVVLVGLTSSLAVWKLAWSGHVLLVRRDCRSD